MALVTSGEISIGGSTTNRSINLELGRSATATSSLGETALRNLAGVSSGAISLSSFYGKSSLAAVLNAYGGSTTIDLYDYYFNSYSYYAESFTKIVLNSNGTAQYAYGNTSTAQTNFTSFTWKTGGGSVGDYYARVTNFSGSFYSAPANNALHALSTTREWMVLAVANGNPASGYAGASGTLEICRSDGSVLTSRSFNLYAEAITGTPF
jgi:hypothetical protein